MSFSGADRSIYQYINRLKPLKTFYDSIGKKDIVESFKLPRPPVGFPVIPTKLELQTFYSFLPTIREKAIFLILASTGLRLHEVASLLKSDIEFETRRVIPQSAHQTDSTKRALYSYYNAECESVLGEYLSSRQDSNPHLFVAVQSNGHNVEDGYLDDSTIERVFREASEKSAVKVTPQTLRDFFAEEICECGLAERYIDFLCGRTPKSVLAKHYSDYKPFKMKTRYDKAALKVLS